MTTSVPHVWTYHERFAYSQQVDLWWVVVLDLPGVVLYFWFCWEDLLLRRTMWWCSNCWQWSIHRGIWWYWCGIFSWELIFRVVGVIWWVDRIIYFWYLWLWWLLCLSWFSWLLWRCCFFWWDRDGRSIRMSSVISFFWVRFWVICSLFVLYISKING